MANRRMFSQTIIDSDAFLDMPSSTQVLYFHLSMRADDEGFVNSPKKIQRMIGCNDDDMKLLILKRFILLFESGVIVIKHWKIHNCIRKDRLVETSYKEEKALLYEKENLAYTLDKTKAKDTATICQPSDNQVTTNSQPDGCIGKDSIGEDRLGKDSIVKDKKAKPKGFSDLINEYTSDESLRISINDFIEMRKKNKKNMTERALELMLRKLDGLADNEVDKKLILNQSIENCWQGIFPLKDKHNQRQPKQQSITNNPFLRMEIEGVFDDDE